MPKTRVSPRATGRRLRRQPHGGDPRNRAWPLRTEPAARLAGPADELGTKRGHPRKPEPVVRNADRPEPRLCRPDRPGDCLALRRAAGVRKGKLYQHFIRVVPGFIRVEADELTLPLHVILRYRIERALIEGEIEAEDIPRCGTRR